MRYLETSSGFLQKGLSDLRKKKLTGSPIEHQGSD